MSLFESIQKQTCGVCHWHQWMLGSKSRDDCVYWSADPVTEDKDVPANLHNPTRIRWITFRTFELY